MPKAKPAAGAQQQPSTSRPTGRYTPPIPRSVRRSPAWYPYVILTLVVVGILIIIGNYAGFLPDSPTTWYLVGGILGIVVGLGLATNYH